MSGMVPAGGSVRPVLILVAAVCAFLASWPHRPGVPTCLRVRVAIPGPPNAEATLEVVHAGVSTHLALLDDGTGADVAAGDGIRSAEWAPPGPAVLVPVGLWLRPADGSPAVRVHSAIHPLLRGPNDIAWEVIDGPSPEVRERAHPGPRRAAAAAEGRRTALNMGFVLVALGVVLRCVRRPVGDGGSPGADEAVARRIPVRVSDALFWFAIAVLWTWPAALGGPALLIGRQFDTPSTIWVMHAAHRLLRSLIDPYAEWPLQADHHGLDSFLMLPIAALLHALHVARVHAGLQILGVALSGWAAQGFARATGVRRPWETFAGLTYACSGAMASALLEGQVYHALNPWLPLFGWAFWRTTSADARPRDALAAAVAFALCLATSGYVGVSAMIVGAGLVAGAARGGVRVPRRPALLAVAACGALALAYALTAFADAPLRRDLSLSSMRLASAHLVSLAGPTPETDRAGQSMAAAISPVVLAWLVAAFALGRAGPRARTLLWTGAAGLLIALGPAWALDARGASVPSPLRLLVGTPFDVILRFPLRSMGVWNLCAGIVAFGAAQRLAGRGRGTAAVVGALAVAHAFLIVGLPFRQAAQPFHVPSAYREAGGPVLDLHPDPQGLRDEMWLMARVCACQVGHGQPIADNAASTEPGGLPRMRLGRWLRDELAAGRADAAARALGAMGFAAVAFHGDFFPPEERSVIENALGRFGTRRTVSADAGERLVLQAVPPPPEAPGAAARRAAYDAAVGGRPGAGVDRDSVTARDLDMAGGIRGPVALAGWLAFGVIAVAWVRITRRAAAGAGTGATDATP